MARIYDAHEQLLRGGCAAAAAEATQEALAAGLPPGTETNAGLLALFTLRDAERHELALRLLDAASEQARREGHATRQGIIHVHRAAIALADGSLHDAQVEADTGLRLVDERHFLFPLLLAVAIVAHLERGTLADALELARRGEALELTAEGTYAQLELAVARARLRIAQGDVRGGAADLAWWGREAEALGLRWPATWKAHAARALGLAGRARDGRRPGRRAARGRATRGGARRAGNGVARRGARGGRAGPAPAARGGRLGPGAQLVPAGARVTRWSTSAASARAPGGAARAATPSAARSRSPTPAARCPLAEQARAELQAGPGRRARLELTGRGALTAAEWRVCRQAADGRTNREIAQALFVTEKTVERHLSSAYQKLAIRSRFQLAAAISD